MKINELNEAGVPHLPAPRGTHLPAVVKPTPVSTIFTAPEPKVNAKPNPTVKPVADITDVKPKDVPNKPAVDLKTQNAAAAEKGPRGRGAAGLATGALVGLGAASLMSPNKQNPTANTQPATTTTTTPTNVVTPSPVKPKPNLNYKGSEGSQSLMALNPDKIKNVNQIRAGDSIDLGGGNMYKIQKGDTLDKIAQRMTRPSGQPRAELDKPDSVLPRELEKPPAPAPVVNTPLPEPREAGIAAANDLPYTPPAPEPEPTQAATTTLPEPREAGIAAANDQTSPPPVRGTPELPYEKGPEVKNASGETWKDREGNAIRTRSDAEIGDTNPRTGVVTPGSYDKNRANGEKNLQSVKNFFGIKEELNRIRTLSGMSHLTEAPVAPLAPTTATNASSLRAMQNNAGSRPGTTTPTAPAANPAVTSAGASGPPGSFQRGAGIQAATVGGGRGNAQAELAARRAAPTQAATTTPPNMGAAMAAAGGTSAKQPPSAGGGRGFVNPTMPKTQAATTAPAAKPQPQGPAVGSQAQTAGGANELAKTGIMGGQPAPTAAPANPGTQAAGSAFNQGNLGTRAPAATPSAFNQGALGTRAPATQPTSGSPMAGVNAGSGTANNTTMAPQQAPAQSAMNQASNTQAATTSGSPMAGVSNASSLRTAQNNAGSQTGTTAGSGSPMAGIKSSAPTTSGDADMAEFDRDVADMNGTGAKPNQGGPETQAIRDFEESIMRESTMELNLLRKYSGMPELTESDVTVHKGDYGNKYEPEVVRDQYGHKIGKVNKGAEASKDAPKRGRGRPTKGDKDEHGNDTKFDTSGLQGMLGGKPKGEVGKKSVKHSLKDWIEVVSDNMINESTQLDEEAMGQIMNMFQQFDGRIQNGEDPKQAVVDMSKDYKMKFDVLAAWLADFAKDSPGWVDTPELANAVKTLRQIRSDNQAFDPQIEEGEEEKKKENTPQSPISKEFKQVFRMNHNRRSVEEGAKPDFLDVDKDKNKKESFKKAVDDKKKNPFAKKVKETKDLPGNRDNLDVAPPKGELTKADFEALRKKKKVSEARVMEESEYTYEKVGKILAQENPTLASDSDEFANAVYHEMIQMGMTPKSAHYKLNHDPDFLGEVATAYHHYLGQNTVDEAKNNTTGMGQTPPYMPPKKPENGMGSIVQGTWQSNPRGTVKAPSGDPEGVKEAGSFIRNLASSRRAFEGKNMKDMQVETWKSTLNELINENLTISTTIDDQGHDSVNVSATEGNAHEIIELLRNAGLGGMGGSKQEHGQQVNNYGLPMSNDEHSGPEAQLIAVGSPHAHSEMGDEGGDDMMQLIQKMTDIEGSGEEHNHEGHEEHEGECETCGESPCACDDTEEEVDEGQDFGPGRSGPNRNQAGPEYSFSPDTDNYKTPNLDRNAEIDNRGYTKDWSKEKVNTEFGPSTKGAQAHLGAYTSDGQGQTKYVDRTTPGVINTIKDKMGWDKPDPAYGPKPDERERLLKNHPAPVKEAGVEEGNAFTDKLNQTPQGGEFSLDGNEYTDTSSIEEGHETCNECGGMMYEGHSCGFANSADDTADQDLEYMMKTISGGLNGQKRDQSTAPIIKIVTAEGTLMKDSTDLLSDFRKLSGI
jgi:hypothetical protein